MMTIADKIISFADRLAARQAPLVEDQGVDEELFLLDEGLDVLASYRSISDRATRQRLRELVDAAARGDVPQAPAKIIPLIAQPAGRRATAIGHCKKAAVFAALLIGSGVLLEVVDPAPTDVEAGSTRCAPTAAKVR